MPATYEAQLDELLFNAFITALEGGVQYWAEVDKYRWSVGDSKTEDTRGFRAVLRERSEHEHETPQPWLVVDRAVMLRGLEHLANGTCTWGGRELSKSYQRKAIGWHAVPEHADIDANDADNIVQAGLFGDVRYG
jgi:hypothetical protein